jgi:hypothetical protein
MSKQGLLNILEGALDILKRIVLFLPALIGLIEPPKKRVKKSKDTNASSSS